MWIWERHCIDSTVREFQEHGQDSDCTKYRMEALWEADQAMRDAINHREHATDCLA
jgi:hypothetical protein